MGRVYKLNKTTKVDSGKSRRTIISGRRADGFDCFSGGAVSGNVDWVGVDMGRTKSSLDEFFVGWATKNSHDGSLWDIERGPCSSGCFSTGDDGCCGQGAVTLRPKEHSLSASMGLVLVEELRARTRGGGESEVMEGRKQ
jgi:hypothetical protein